MASRGGKEQAATRAEWKDREAALWREWRQTADATSRGRLIEFYDGWVQKVAQDVFLQIPVQGAEWADYVHYGNIGLMESIDRFDPTRGAQFQTFARHRVRGAILNNIGRFAERTGRSTRYFERLDSIEETESDDALADIVDATVGLAIGYLLELGTLPSGNTENRNTTYDNVEAGEEQASLVGKIGELPEREQQVIRYHYFQQISFTEIADMLGVTRGRVSQLHRQAIERIRDDMSSNGGLDRSF